MAGSTQDWPALGGRALLGGAEDGVGSDGSSSTFVAGDHDPLEEKRWCQASSSHGSLDKLPCKQPGVKMNDGFCVELVGDWIESLMGTYTKAVKEKHVFKSLTPSRETH